MDSTQADNLLSLLLIFGGFAALISGLFAGLIAGRGLDL